MKLFLNHKRCYWSCFLFLLFMQGIRAGEGVFQFLDLPVSSRMAALGGKHVSLPEHDVNFAFQNPALLRKEVHNMIGLNMANYLADIQFGTGIYARNYGENTFAVGVQYVDYGTFKETTEYNEMLGEFTAKDVALHLIYSRRLTERMQVGATLKPVYSAYERYVSYGVAVDVGASYRAPNDLFAAGLVLRNIGTQFKGYYAGVDGQHLEPLPFDMLLGGSYKLEHAPFRFSLTLHNLHDWDMSYVDNEDSLMEYIQLDYVPGIAPVDLIFRHAILGVDFIPGNNLYLTASYNHRRHQELKMPGFKSMAGFSFGGGITISRFQVGFGMSTFQTGNVAYLFSISTSLNEFNL